MQRITLGISLRDLRLPTKEAVGRAARLGFDAVELCATEGDTSPRALSASGRRHLARLIRSTGVHIASLDAGFQDRGLADPAHADQRVADTKAIFELARDLGVPVVTAAPGTGRGSQTPGELSSPLGELAAHADRTGVTFALQSRDAAPATLNNILRALDCPSVGLCVDPGALVMGGHDPVTAVAGWPSTIRLSHARDAVHDGHAGVRETELGEGQVDFVAYLAALAAAGYAGPQIIRRSTSADPTASFARAKAFLEAHTPLRT